MAAAPVAEAPIRPTLKRQIYELSVKLNWTLQYVLHDKLGFTSIKDVCTGKGECGACTCHYGGETDPFVHGLGHRV